MFDATAQSSKGDVKTFVANTVYDGMNINITMQRTEGDVTTVDYDTFSKIVSSVKFSDLPFSKGFIPYIIIGGGVVILILIVLIIIFAVRIRKHKKVRRITLFLRSLQSSINSVKRVRTTTLTILTILPKSPINAQRKSRDMRKRLKKNRLCRAEDMLPSR